jgi:flagellar basal body-associated protein FliL
LRIFLVLIAFCGSILFSLFPFYLAYQIINPNSFFGIVGVFLLGLIIIPLITFIIMTVLGLLGISFESIKNFLKSVIIKNHHNENIQRINQPSSNEKKTNIFTFVKVLLICAGCIFLIIFLSQNNSNEYNENENEYSASSEVFEDTSTSEVFEDISTSEVFEDTSTSEVFVTEDNLSLESNEKDLPPEVIMMKGTCSDVVIASEESFICSNTLNSTSFSDGTVLFNYVLNLGTDDFKVLTFSVDTTKELHSNENERIAKVYAVDINSPSQKRNLDAKGVCVYQNPYRNVSALIQCRASTDAGDISATFYTDGSQPIEN